MTAPAKVLRAADVRRLLERVAHSRHPVRHRILIMLSFKAGLRACEMAGLDWAMMLRPNGRLASYVEVGRHIAKGRSHGAS